MNRIEELINELCPQGIPYVNLESLLDYIQPSPYIVKSTDYNNTFPIPVLTAGQSFILGYTNEDFGIYKSSTINPCIIFDDFTTSYKWVDFEFKVKSSALKILIPKKEDILIRYVYYAMSCIQFVPSEHARHWISKYSQFQIPYPPLKIQQEIVSILDKFTNHIADLDLAIKLRQKQFEYCREKLLTFNEGECEWKKLGEIGTITRGTGLQKKDFTEEGVGCVHYGQIYTKLGFSLKKTLTYVPKTLADKLVKVNPGNLIVATTSENVEDVCKSVVWLGDETIVTGAHACVLRHSEDSKYIGYCFLSSNFQLQKRQFVYGAKVIDIKTDSLGKILLPIPSLEKQKSIVSILDKFADHIADLEKTKDLRQKQYEYYRNKLLSFK